MDNSGANTVILVIILALIVGSIVWFTTREKVEEPEQGIQLDVNLPMNNDNEEGQPN